MSCCWTQRGGHQELSFYNEWTSGLVLSFFSMFWVSEKVPSWAKMSRKTHFYFRFFQGCNNRGLNNTLSVVWPANQVLIARATAMKEKRLQQTWHFALRPTLGFQGCSILGLQSFQERGTQHSRFPGADPGFWPGGPAEFWQQREALSPKFAHSSFSLNISWKLNDFEKNLWGNGAQGSWAPQIRWCDSKGRSWTCAVWPRLWICSFSHLCSLASSLSTKGLSVWVLC